MVLPYYRSNGVGWNVGVQKSLAYWKDRQKCSRPTHVTLQQRLTSSQLLQLLSVYTRGNCLSVTEYITVGYTVCMCGHHFQQTGHQPGMVANPACGQLAEQGKRNFPAPVRA